MGISKCLRVMFVLLSALLLFCSCFEGDGCFWMAVLERSV